MRNTWTVDGLAMLLAAVSATWAPAASVSFSSENLDGGTGFGNVLSVLSLSDKDHDDSEWGSISYDAVNAVDVLGGEAASSAGTFTRTVAEMAAKGIDGDNLGVIFNLNEPGSATSLYLGWFSLVFQDTSGAVLFTADYTPASPVLLDSVDQGTGSSGFLFRINLSAAEKASFFDDSANRLGMSVPSSTPMADVGGGQENFYLAPAPTSVITTVAPLPASVWGGVGLLGVLGLRRVARSRRGR